VSLDASAVLVPHRAQVLDQMRSAGDHGRGCDSGQNTDRTVAEYR
jgi:hypothetical protein